ncbi:sensor histidine kinase [Paenibacillus assamensis]|uniref:sensor histidine kinase n=1 Tax=Paenibacillus assamensis TaxID=311244 RepID=UPI00041C046F|nr:HAMP domain-containing sensor histidine kinase [Paenibacillus assamensis]
MSLIKDVLSDFEYFMSRIDELRNVGEYHSAIHECLQHIETAPLTIFKFYYLKELGELYSLVSEFEKSVRAYAQAYDYINNDEGNFKIFARSVERFLKVVPGEYYEKFRDNLVDKLNGNKINIAYQLSNLLDYSFPLENFLSPLGKELADLMSKDVYFKEMVPKLRRLETSSPEELLIILDIKVLDRKRTFETIQIDKYCITVYERLEKYYNAQKIAYELIEIKQDSVMIRSLFRLCRKMDDYNLANQLLLKEPTIEKRVDFNILYELVYYYDKINNTLAKKSALAKIEGFSESQPILRTLKNLYLRFGTFEDVLRVERMLSKSSYSKKSKGDTVKDSEASVWSALENSKRLEALANLTQGISHELGQPITNIRFMIQYYMNRGQDSLDQNTIYEMFQTVLLETERMGDLINRLSPITTAKNTMIEYNVMERIRLRIKAEFIRLESEGIFVDIPPSPDIAVYGDPSMFDQIFSNLLNNSIHSLQSSDKKRKQISIRIKADESKIRISFQDNGVGISQENRRKIFEPFFTTKPTGQGQGLGLFIIWNLLKYQGGTIFLDYKFNKGARFIIELPKEAIRYE